MISSIPCTSCNTCRLEEHLPKPQFKPVDAQWSVVAQEKDAEGYLHKLSKGFKISSYICSARYKQRNHERVLCD